MFALFNTRPACSIPASNKFSFPRSEIINNMAHGYRNVNHVHVTRIDFTFHENNIGNSQLAKSYTAKTVTKTAEPSSRPKKTCRVLEISISSPSSTLSLQTKLFFLNLVYFIAWVFFENDVLIRKTDLVIYHLEVTYVINF